MQHRAGKKNTFLRILLSAAAFFSAGLVCEVASAFPGTLGLKSELPDIGVLGPTLVNYDATSSTFTANNVLPYLSYLSADGLSDQIITGASYSLTATLDSANNYDLDTAGVNTLDIQGDLGFGVESLLTANIVHFGFAGNIAGSVGGNGVGEGVFEFLLNITSSKPSLGFGAHAGVIIASSNLTGFALTALTGGQSFTGTGTADTFNKVPEPSSILLLLIGLSALSVRQLVQSRSGRPMDSLAVNA